MAHFLVFYRQQLLDFSMRFEELLVIIFSGNLSDKLPNRNIFKLLLLCLITLVLLLNSPAKSGIVFHKQKTDMLNFDNYKKLFSPNTSLLILLSIMSFELFL